MQSEHYPFYMRNLILSFFLICSIAASAQKLNTLSGATDNAQQRPKQIAEWLGTGWNLGNQFDAHQGGVSNETCWGNGAVTPALFDSLKAVGVKSVRIPVTWMGHIGKAPRYEIAGEWMNRVKEVVGYAHDAGLNVIINIHHDGADSRYWLDIRKAAKDNKAKNALVNQFAAVWKQIAWEFRDEDHWLIFEPFNELHDGKWGWGENLTDGGAQYAVVNELNQKFVDVVRSTGGKNRDRWLGVSGYCTNIDLTIQHFVMPKDKAKNRLLVAVHCYEPHNYTLEAKYHQWGGDDEKKLEAELRKVYDTYITRGIPVYIGEMGCVRRSDPADEAVRLHYLSCYARFCKLFSLPFFYWDNGSNRAGRECSGLVNHANGQWYNDGKEIMSLLVMMFGQTYVCEKD